MAAMFGALTTFDANAGTIKYSWTASLTMAGVEEYEFGGGFYATMPMAFVTPLQDSIVDVYGANFIVDGDVDNPQLGWMLTHPDPDRTANSEYIVIFGESITVNVEITSKVIRKCAVSYPTLGGTNSTHTVTVSSKIGRELIGKYGLDFIDYYDELDVKVTIGGKEFTGKVTPSADTPIAGLANYCEVGGYNYINIDSTGDDDIYTVAFWSQSPSAGIHERTTVVDITWTRKIDEVDCTCDIEERTAESPLFINGHLYGSVSGNTAKLEFSSDDYYLGFTHGLAVDDLFGAMTVGDEIDLENIDGVSRESTVTGGETKAYIDDSDPDNPVWYWRESGELRPFSGYPVAYTGAANINMFNIYHEFYADIPEPQDTEPELNGPWPCLQFGSRKINNISPTYEDGDWVEGSMHEPMPWSDPNPEGGDCYSLMYSDSPLLHDDEALVLSLAAPGSVLGSPLDFTAGTYTPTNCTVSKPGDGRLKIATAGATGEAKRTSINGLYFYGGRFARVYWTSTAGAKARLWLGGKSWEMEYQSGQSYTEIDLCLPDDATAADVAQSIAPIVKPLDNSGHGIELPALWGVGYVSEVKLELLTANADYYFSRIDLIRKAAGEGGFAKLLVSHANGPWNDIDSDDLRDFSKRVAAKNDEAFLTPKAYLIIDGAVVWELMQGEHRPDDNPVYYKLTRPIASGGIGLPLDDYDSPTKYPVYGLTVTPKNYTQQDTKLIDSFCLVGLLDGGEYLPDANNQIAVGLTLRPEYWRTWGACTFRPDGSWHRFRSTVFGLVFNADGSPYNGTIQARTAYDDFTVQCNSLGFYYTPALYNRYPGKVTDGGTGHLIYDPISGHLIYDPATGHLIYDSGKIRTIEMRSRLQSRLSLRRTPDN